MTNLELPHWVYGPTYLLAVSGGMDSMVMAHVFLEKGFRFHIAHCNFQLRGEEADREEILVKDWCLQHHIPFHLKKVNTKTYAEEHKLSIQLAARHIRYEFFHHVRMEHNLDFIATAHHNDDNVETMIFNFSRGTGLQGLTGIPEKNGDIIRPILSWTKKQIRAYAEENQILYLDDSSNFKTEYTRNKIRLELLPLWEKLFPSLSQNLTQNRERFAEQHEVYQTQIATYRKKLLEQRGKDFFIPILKLKQFNTIKTIVYELLKPFDFSYDQSLQALDLMDAQSGHFIDNPTFRIIKNRQFLIITEKNTVESTWIHIQQDDKKIITDDFILTQENHEETPHHLSKEVNTCTVDNSQLEYPLLLRKWKQGDYLYPFGMQKKKKVARVLIDAKIPLHEKDKVWVLVSNDKIVWIVGIKADNRFRTSGQTLSHTVFHVRPNI